MILETAVLDVKSGETGHFENAFAEAQQYLAATRGYQRHELRRCLERADRYLLLVWWDSLESHTENFRGSPDYERWSQLLHSFYDPFPEVEHYAIVSLVDRPKSSGA